MARLNLTAQQICDKQFNSDFKGYNPTEVDSFLDLILEDYDVFENTIQQLRMEIERLKADRTTLQTQLIELQGQQRATNAAGANNNSQLDILKRLSRLEEVVYNNMNNRNG